MEQKLKDISLEISKLTLLEASELVKMLEETLGVSAAAPMMMAAAAPAAVEKEEEKTEFDVVLVSGGPNKINVIKEVRAVTGLALKEAKEAAEGSNVVLKTGISKKDAEAAKKQLEAVGAEVKLV
jgi:large subunit ribosomal protein L7/L12